MATAVTVTAVAKIVVLFGMCNSCNLFKVSIGAKNAKVYKRVQHRSRPRKAKTGNSGYDTNAIQESAKIDPNVQKSDILTNKKHL